MLNDRDLAHPLAGGVEVHLEEVATRLVRDHGFEITVLCAGFEGGPSEEERGGVRYLRSGDRGFSYYAQLPGRARREVVGGGYDLVVENLCKLLFFSPLYLPGIPKLGLVHHLFGLSAFRSRQRDQPTVRRDDAARLRMLEAICLASLQSQTNQDFTWPKTLVFQSFLWPSTIHSRNHFSYLSSGKYQCLVTFIEGVFPVMADLGLIRSVAL